MAQSNIVPTLTGSFPRLQSLWKRHRLFICLATGVWLIYLAFLPPGIYSVDGNSMLAVSESLITQHSLGVPVGLGVVGRNGLTFSSWYPLLSLLAVPLVYAASILSRFAQLPLHYVAAIFSLVLSGVFTAATSSLVAALSVRLGCSLRGAWLAGLSFAFGTIALVYARTFFAEPLLALLTVGAMYLAFGRSRTEISSAACLAALAVLAKPTGIVIGPILSVYLLAKRENPRAWLLPFCGSLLGFALYAGYNEWRFSNPLTFGQSWTFSLSYIPQGITGLLLSPGFGLLWYCPVLVLAALAFRLVARSYFLEALTTVAIFIAFLLLHSAWASWQGGWSWGPRFLLPGLPGLCALMGSLTGNRRRWLVLFSLLGFLVNSPTLLFFYERCFAELNEQGVSFDRDLAWSMNYAPLLQGWPAAICTVKDASRQDVKELFNNRGAPSATIAKSRALRIVAVWWWVLPVANLSRWVGLLVAIILVVIGSLILARAAPSQSE
jgi:hypothetical protein